MRALVTGASGFLGRHVVAALLRSGHRVRTLRRTRAAADRIDSAAQVQSLYADLVGSDPLEPAFEGVDVLVHLAAGVLGSDHERLHVAVHGTERLLSAMARTATRRVVLASSFAVYDWERVGCELSEDSALRAPDAQGCDGYARAKLLQEAVARRFAEQMGWSLTILRPPGLWGAGRLDEGSVGRRAGPLRIVVGPCRRLRLCYVENCADAFVSAAESAEPGVRTLNVIDGEGISAWRYAKECDALGSTVSLRIPLPYLPTLGCLRAAESALRVLTRGQRRLPGILSVARFQAQFRPVACSTAKARRVLGWVPRVGHAEAVERTRLALREGPRSHAPVGASEHTLRW
jgi:UDP-glucose 4-epimerase